MYFLYWGAKDYSQIINSVVEISTVIDYNLIFSSYIAFYERMNVNDKPATLWLQDNLWKKYTKFPFHKIMTETRLYRFCNRAKTERLRSMMQYTTHYN